LTLLVSVIAENKNHHTSGHRLIIALICMVLVVGKGLSQKKLTDSLLQKKISYENLPGFIEQDTNYIKLLYALSLSYIYQIPDSTRNISEKVLQLSEQRNFKKGIAGGKMGLGLYYIINGEFIKGHVQANEAIDIAKNIKADTILLKSYNVKAMGQFMKGDYPNAYLECKAGERLAKQVGNIEMQVLFAMNLASCFGFLRDYKEAMNYYEKALSFLENSNKELQKSQIQSNIGSLYAELGEYEPAKEYSIKSIKIFKEKGLQAWEAFAWTTLGEVAIAEKQYQKALDYFSMAESLLDPIGDMQRTAETAMCKAEVFYSMGEYTKSLENAKTSNKIFKEIQYHFGIVESSKLLYKLLQKENHLKEALEHLNVAKHLSDSILESENRTKFLILEAKAKFDQINKISEFESEKQLTRQKTITYISVVFLFAVSIILLLIRRNAINQKKANDSLKELNSAKDKLFSIIGHDLKAPISTLQELLSLYSSQEISEEDIAKLAPRLKQNVDHSSFTLNNLLFWAKAQMNGILPEKETILIKDKARYVCDTYCERIKLKEIDIQCNISPDEKLSVDPTHFEIILRNLISNAIKYTHKGGTIHFNCKRNDSSTIEISICDSGIGMSKSTVNVLLNKQAVQSQAGTINEKGTGIGFQIVQDLVKANDGNVKIQSKPNNGTCVFLYFQIT